MRRKIGLGNGCIGFSGSGALLAHRRNSQPAEQKGQHCAATKYQWSIFLDKVGLRLGRWRRSDLLLRRRRFVLVGRLRRGDCCIDRLRRLAWLGRFCRFAGVGRFGRFHRHGGLGYLGRLWHLCCLRRLGGFRRLCRLHHRCRNVRLLGFRRSRLCCLRLLLQVGTGLALQLGEFLQVAKVLFQIDDATARLLERPVARHQILFQRCDAALQGLALGILRRFRARDFQLVLARGRGHLVFDFGGDLAGDGLPGALILRRLGGCSRGQTLAISVEIRRLGNNFLARLACGNRTHCFGIGNRKNLAGLEAIHVAAVKRLLVAAEQGYQHLIEADAFRLGLRRDFAQCVT